MAICKNKFFYFLQIENFNSQEEISMRNYYADPTGNAAISAVDKELRRMSDEAKMASKVKKQRDRRLKRYEENRKNTGL